MITDSVTTEESALQLLRLIHFFDNLKIEDLERLATLVTFKSFEPGEVIFRQGDPPGDFYIIKQGRVEIVREDSDGSEVIATLSRAGDFFGEMALIEDRPRSATVRTGAQTELLIVSCSDFNELIQSDPSIHREISRALSYNLRHTDSRFTETILEKNRQLAEALANLKAAQEELLRRERLSLVGKLASGVIHDLKKPLTCISGYAQLLGGQSLAEEKRRQYSGKIIHEVQRLVNMVNEILQFARGEQQIGLGQTLLQQPAGAEFAAELLVVGEQQLDAASDSSARTAKV